MESDDIQIVNRCLSGEGEAFEEIVIRHKKKIYNIAYRFTGSSQDALDITQEVFIKAYNSLKQYNPQYKFSTWILKIATNYCIDLKRKKEVNTVPYDPEIDTGESHSNPESILLHRESKREIGDAIRELSEEYRLLIIMYHQQNLSYNEIAEALNLPLTIVKNRLYRGRLMLKERLGILREEEGKWTAKELQH